MMFFSVSLILTTKPKPIVDKQNNCLFTKEGTKGERKKQETMKHQKTMNKMTFVSPYLLIITLNVNGLNFSAKSHRVPEWI